jgi:hypothetical protein
LRSARSNADRARWYFWLGAEAETV